MLVHFGLVRDYLIFQGEKLSGFVNNKKKGNEMLRPVELPQAPKRPRVRIRPKAASPSRQTKPAESLPGVRIPEAPKQEPTLRL